MGKLFVDFLYKLYLLKFLKFCYKSLKAKKADIVINLGCIFGCIFGYYIVFVIGVLEFVQSVWYAMQYVGSCILEAVILCWYYIKTFITHALSFL